MFTQEPCGEVIAAIDWADTASPEAIILERGMKGLTQDMAVSSMMWGMLLGYDLHSGGLHTPEQTTLERLRAACEAAPSNSAKTILDGF